MHEAPISPRKRRGWDEGIERQDKRNWCPEPESNRYGLAAEGF